VHARVKTSESARARVRPRRAHLGRQPRVRLGDPDLLFLDLREREREYEESESI
jgi:hypothetical protein